MTLALVLAVIVVLVLIEVPVAFAFGAGVLVLAYLRDLDVSYLLPSALWLIGSFAILAVPLFIMAGTLMAASGISDRLIAFVNAGVGRIKGGLGAVTVISCTIFGAISGSGAAAIAAIGSIMIPRMVSEGYPREYATALVGCSSVLALMIPPSIPMIIFALTANLSVAACFLSTAVPGVIVMIGYCVLNFLYLRKVPTVKVAPKVSLGEAVIGMSQATKNAFFALLMPVIMLGGIYSGIFTPTETAAVTVAYTLLVGFLIYRTLDGRSLVSAVLRAVIQTGTFIIILFFLFNLSRVMVLDNVPSTLAKTMLGLSENKYVVLFMINVLLLLIGMLVDDVSGGILAAVVLLPVAQQIGVHPIHFAAIVGTNLGLGNVTPPCAPLLFVASAVGETPFTRLIGTTLKLSLLGHLPAIFLVTYIPDIALFLPRLVLNIL